MIAALAPFDLRLVRKLDDLSGLVRSVSMCRTPGQVAELLELVSRESLRLHDAADALSILTAGGELDPAYRVALERQVRAVLGPQSVMEVTS